MESMLKKPIPSFEKQSIWKEEPSMFMENNNGTINDISTDGNGLEQQPLSQPTLILDDTNDIDALFK